MSDPEKESIKRENAVLKEELRKCKIRNLNLTYVRPTVEGRHIKPPAANTVLPDVPAEQIAQLLKEKHIETIETTAQPPAENTPSETVHEE